MPSPYPKELRERVITAWRAGNASMKAIGERFDLAERTVARWVARLSETGSTAPLPTGGARRAYVVDAAGGEYIRETLDVVADLTLPELCELYRTTRGVTVSPQTMSDTVRRLGYTRKKGLSGPTRRAARTS
jgi:transposase